MMDEKPLSPALREWDRKLELRHLYYFVAVAEERHFTRAATRVGIQQPPLSLQIQQLERDLGGPLFVRQSRDVALTELGQALLPEARRILEQVERMRRQMRQLSQGEVGRIRLGFAGATYLEPRIPKWVHRFRTLYPGVQLLPEQSNTARLIKALADDEIDAAFVRTPFDAPAGVTSIPVADEEMVLAMPAGHPLTRLKRVPLALLVDDEFILLPRDISPGLYDLTYHACEAAGFRPKLGQEAAQITSIVPMVATGFGVSLVPRSVMQIRSPGVIYRPLEGVAPRAAIGLAYRSAHHSVALERFIDIVSHSIPA